MLNNNVKLIGRLTKDLELRKTPQGVSVVQFDLAVNRYKKEDGADFIRCQVWKHGAEYLTKYASKGTLIALDGRINTRSYVNQQGQKVYVTEVIGDDVKVLVSPQATTSNEYEQPSYQSNYQQPNVYQQTLTADNRDMVGYSNDLNISPDELPFY